MHAFWLLKKNLYLIYRLCVHFTGLLAYKTTLWQCYDISIYTIQSDLCISRSHDLFDWTNQISTCQHTKNITVLVIIFACFDHWHYWLFSISNLVSSKFSSLLCSFLLKSSLARDLYTEYDESVVTAILVHGHHFVLHQRAAVCAGEPWGWAPAVARLFDHSVAFSVRPMPYNFHRPVKKNYVQANINP